MSMDKIINLQSNNIFVAYEGSLSRAEELVNKYFNSIYEKKLNSIKNKRDNNLVFSLKELKYIIFRDLLVDFKMSSFSKGEEIILTNLIINKLKSNHLVKVKYLGDELYGVEKWAIEYRKIKMFYLTILPILAFVFSKITVSFFSRLNIFGITLISSLVFFIVGLVCILVMEKRLLILRR